MSFVLLLLLSITTLAKVESTSAGRSQQMMAARQNAYFGLMVAIGELQKSAGPDQRITARADILDAAVGGVDPEQPYWLGVWDSDIVGWEHFTATEKMNSARWLVSGNQGRSPGDSGYLTPKSIDAGVETVELFPSNEDHEITAVRVPSELIVSPNGSTAGHFAYWISEENSKALVSLFDPYASSLDEVERLRSFQVPQRTGVNALDGLADYPVNDEELGNVLRLSSQMSEWISDDTIDAPEFVSVRSNDLTTWSKGLLVDVKDGALKRDLTQAFEINASFDAHFPDVIFGSQSDSDTAAADPTSEEPYYMIEDSVIVSGSPNWSVFRDYYQHYWPATSSSEDGDYQIYLKAQETSHDGTQSNAYKYLPYRTPQYPSDPYAGGDLPYQRVYNSDQYSGGDNYQYNSWITPVIGQFRISHAFRLQKDAGGDGRTIPEIIIQPVLSVYNPYHSHPIGMLF
jgi:hypothetical protein